MNTILSTPRARRWAGRTGLLAVALVLAGAAGCAKQNANKVTPVGPQPVVAVAVSPPSATIAAGSSTALTATPQDAHGDPLTGRVVTWSSNHTNIATVDGNGMVTGLAAGDVVITATCEGIAGGSTITVSAVPVASVAVSPAAASVDQASTVQLTATPKDGGGTPLTGRVVAWSSDNLTAATVNGSGRVSGVAAGSATITATCEGKTGTSSITVTRVAVASVTVAPASASVDVAYSVQLTATPKDGSGTPLAGRTVTWSSDNLLAATVNGSGRVTGVAPGGATITATCEGKTGTSSITVTVPTVGGGLIRCQIFPKNNIWNTDISTLPVHPKSATFVATMGANQTLWAGFSPNSFGMKYALTNAFTPKVNIAIVGQDPSDSDVPGPYPFTATTPLEVGTPDAHAFMIDTTTCTLYEMYLAEWNGGNPQAHAAVIWNLASNALRADGHSSADEAGLAMFCGLIRWDEIQAGAIRHALRFEATEAHIDGTTGAHLWPARHDTQTPNTSAAPMGARFRLKMSYDISGYSPHTQVVLRALQHYGMFLSDVGLDWELIGTADPAMDTSMIAELMTVPTNQFEVVDESGLMVDPNSMESKPPPP